MMRNSWLVALYALLALSSAFNLGDGLNLDGVAEYLHHGEKRQATGTGGGASTPAPNSTPAPPPASSRQPAPAPSATPPPRSTPAPEPDDPEPSSNAPVPASSNNPAPSNGNQASATPRSSANAPPAESSRAESSAPRTTAIVRTSQYVSTSLQPFVTVIKTISNGAQVEYTSTGTSAIPITSSVQYTDPPSAQNGSGDGNGLSESNKKVIGGVIGGIGGALLLGGIALVFWRMKKRQSKVTADDDDLNLNTGAALGDKPQNGTGASPFQSNLEQYHNPGGRPNAAANF